MIDAVSSGICAAAAWWVGMALLRAKRLRIVVQILLAGVLYGLCVLFLGQVCVPALMPFAEIAVFLFCGCAVAIGNEGGWSDALEAFLLAQGAYAVLRIGAGSAVYGWLVSAAALLLMGTQVVMIKRRYSEWSCGVLGKEDASVRRMFLLSAAVCAVLTAACVLSVSSDVIHQAVIAILSAALFGCSLWIMAIMDAYEQEAKTVQTEQQYRGEMLSFLNLIRSQRHDYNFHVQTIASLIRQGKVEECLHYVNALEEDASIMNAVLPVRDPAISAMIHSFRLQAVRQGIEIHVHILYDLSQIATNVYETNKIISNLLQNAIDEVATHEDKSYGIELSILKRGEYCVIRVANKVMNAPAGDIYRQGYTTKAGHEGVGLSSLRTLATRYHGTIYTQLDGDVIQFVVRIPIDYSKEPYEEKG